MTLGNFLVATFSLLVLLSLGEILLSPALSPQQRLEGILLGLGLLVLIGWQLRLAWLVWKPSSRSGHRRRRR